MNSLTTEKDATSSLALKSTDAGINSPSATAFTYKFSKQGSGELFGNVSLDKPTLTYANLISNTLGIFYELGNITYDPFLTKAVEIGNLVGLGINYLIATGNIKNFPSSIFSLIEAASPGNDTTFPWKPGDNLVLGRGGSDRLLAVNPGDILPGKNEIDILIGSPNISSTHGLNNDIYILGDYNKSYYVDNQGNLGADGFAYLPFFNSKTDTIQLHGNLNDYQIVTFKGDGITGRAETGTAIFLNSSEPDLIAVLPGVSGLSLDTQCFKYVNTPPPQEIQPQIKQFGTASFETAIGVSTDSNGNVYVSGLTGGSLAVPNLAGSSDAYVAKYDSKGNQEWIRQFGTPVLDYAFGNVVDSNNNIYIAGATTGSLAIPNPGGSMDAYIAKYDTNGNQLWIKQIESTDFEETYHLAIDSKNNIYITGTTTGDLGGKNAGITSITGDPYIAKFDSEGNQMWIKQFGSPEFEDAFGITTDSNDNIFATGWTAGDLAAKNVGAYDCWLTKYDTFGNQLWSSQFGSSNYDFAWANATDSFGNIYVTGWTLGNLEGINVGLEDVFLAKFDTNGNQVWIQQFGSAGADQAYSISIDSNNLVYVAGMTSGDLGGKNAGSDDAFLAKFDTNGNLLGVNQFGTAGVDTAYGINAHLSDQVYVAGVTDGSLGGINAGSYDAFLAIQSFANI